MRAIGQSKRHEACICDFSAGGDKYFWIILEMVCVFGFLKLVCLEGKQVYYINNIFEGKRS